MIMGILRGNAALPAVAAFAFAILLAGNASAATQQYFDENGTGTGFGVTNNSTYTWEDAAWSTDSTGLSASTTFIQDGTGFPRFQSTGTVGDAYTVNVGAAQPSAGLGLQGVSTTVTLNSTGGTVNMAAGLQGILTTTGSNFVVNVPIAGTGGVQPGVFAGTGNIYLNAANTYTGTTNFSSSSVSTYIGNNTAFSTGTLFNSRNAANAFVPILATTTITLANNITNNESGSFSSGFNFAANANSPLTLNGQIRLGTGVNALQIRNNGNNTSTLTLGGVISQGSVVFSGVSGGAIILSAANTFTGTAVVDSANSNNLQLELNNNSAVSTAASLTMANASSKLRLDTSAVGIKAGSIAAVVSGPGGLSKTTTGSLGLSNASNSYTGSTAIATNGGTLFLGASGAMQSSSGVSVGSGGTLDLGTFGQAIGTFSVTGFAGNGTLNPSGNGTIGNNGEIAAALGLGATRTVTVATSNTGSISGIVSGTGGLTKSGAGTLVLTNAANSYAGVTTVSAGTLLLGSTNAISTSPGINVSAATANLNLGGLSQSVGTASVAGGVYNGTAVLGDTLTIVNGGNVHSDVTVSLNNASRVITIASGVGTIDGVLSGSGSGLEKQGAGALVVTNAANTYDGATTITGGTLKLGVNNAIASSTGVTLNGGALDSGSYVHAMTSATLAVSANSGIDVTAGGELDFANSSATAWAASTLNVLGALTGNGRIRFGTDDTGLSTDQLNQIQFDNDPTSLGSARLTTDGYLVPEPSAGLLGMGATLLLGIRRRRRLA
jgi:fibronectin-binding autotransporter adhesin